VKTQGAVNLRTLLILGRVSNLPTVWSNLLAGWFLADGEFGPRLLYLLAGGSLLYVGGMYLNDYCDAEFDAKYCPQRPIPSGKISRVAVGSFAALWFLLGFGCLTLFGATTVAITLLLLAAIVLYDFHHKGVTLAPALMGFCRVLLYFIAATAVQGLGVFRFASVVWPFYLLAIALGLYVAGLTYYARGESQSGKPARWALILVLMPVLLQTTIRLLYSVHPPLTSYLQAWPWQPGFPWSLWLDWWVTYSLLFVGWLAWLLIPFWRNFRPSVGRVVSGMLAGIVLVDMIALTGATYDIAPLPLLVLFALALLLQRFVPAT
jgi:4-hydroxybenzoate polyprenyltransferase